MWVNSTQRQSAQSWWRRSSTWALPVFVHLLGVASVSIVGYMSWSGGAPGWDPVMFGLSVSLPGSLLVGIMAVQLAMVEEGSVRGGVCALWAAAILSFCWSSLFTLLQLAGVLNI